MPPNTALPNDCPIMREKNTLDSAALRPVDTGLNCDHGGQVGNAHAETHNSGGDDRMQRIGAGMKPYEQRASGHENDAANGGRKTIGHAKHEAAADKAA